MSKPKIFRVRNRLRATVFDGGGKYVSAALADSEANLVGITEVCAAAVWDLLGQIDRNYGRGAAREEADPRALYRLVMDLIDVSGHSGVRGMPEACCSFCDLLEMCVEAGTWDWPAVDVHIAALQCMTPEATMPETDRLRIVSGLASLSRRRKPVQRSEAG